MPNAMTHCTWKLSVLMSLLVLVPGVGLAAEEPSLNPPPLPGTAPREPLHLVETARRAEPVQRIHPIARVSAEIGAELLTSFVAGVPGALAGYVACGALGLSPPSSWFPCMDYAGYGFLTGVSLAAPLGVWWGGKLMGGRGTLLGAYLGMGAASVLGLGTTLLVYNDDLQPFVIPLFALVGSVVGYELSFSSEPPAQPSSVASVQPLLSVSATGGALGLGGRF
jgi:hypothetical protein